MAVSHRFLKKASTATLLMWMTVSMLSPVAWAEDAAPTDTPAPTSVPESTPTPSETQVTETPAPTAEPTPEPTAVIDTGDVGAAAETDTTVNTNVNDVPGEITQGSNDCAPQGETPCEGDINIENDNAATVSADLEADAETGTNIITDASGSAEITTGDAAATGLMSTEVNTNVVILSSEETPEPTVTATPTPAEENGDDLQCLPTPTPEVTITPEPTPPVEEHELNVNNTNIADVADNADVTAITGDNTATGNSGSSEIDTGDAEALVNVLNVINTNIVGSDVSVLTLDLTCQENEDIDLNAIWSQLLIVDENGNVYLNENFPQTPNIKITVTNSNQATLANDVNATADTGNNTASDSASATIGTGDAVAAANVTNIVNTNILGSKIFIGIINILSNQKFNLILPRPEYFDPESSALIFRIPVTYANQNQANVQNDVNATAGTGENTSENNGQSSITTGNAVAIANSTTIANLNIIGNRWFFLVLNNAGGWTGNIVNWSLPGSVEKPNLGTNILQLGLDPSATSTEYAGEPANGLPVTFANNNYAEVTNDVNVVANTGGNTATNNAGGAEIRTGNAWALANLFNLINTNIMGSRWFMSTINILGNWSGDAIFAYPDVGVSVAANRTMVEPGDIIDYTLSYDNTGYDIAKGVRVTLDLPDGMSFVSDDGRLTGGCQQTFCSWEVGNILPRHGGDFGISLRVKDDISFDQKQALLSRLIPSARAGDERKSREVAFDVSVGMTDPDPNLSNNNFSVEAVVYEKLQGQIDQRQPVLDLTATNNVNGFVYPGDVVTFEMKVKNTSEVPVKNAQLVQKLYDQSGNYLGSMLFDLGTIEAGKAGRLSFGLKVPAGAEAGGYKTVAYVIGAAPNGNQITSEDAITRFDVRAKFITPVDTQTGNPSAGEVLGASTRGPWCTDRRQDIWIFVMLLLTSTVLFANRVDDKLNRAYAGKKIRKLS
jgi:uncharacterized repeat protein (TIGR01451 family)